MFEWIQKVLQKISKRSKENDNVTSSSEYLDRMREVQKSVKMQVISFLTLLFLALVVLGVLGHFYKAISYDTEVNRLQKSALTNVAFLSQNFDTELLVETLKNNDKPTSKKLYEKTNLYAILLDAEYVYVMLLQNSTTDSFVSFSPVANCNVRGSVLAKSSFPMRMVLLNGYPDAMFDNSYWDDVEDYTAPGPLEAMRNGVVNVSEPIIAHQRWGDLVSGQAPLYYKGELIGFLGVDYNLNVIADKVKKSWLDLSVNLLLVALILIILRTMLMAHINYLTLKKIVHQKYVSSGVFAVKAVPAVGEEGKTDEENN